MTVLPALGPVLGSPATLATLVALGLPGAPAAVCVSAPTATGSPAPATASAPPARAIPADDELRALYGQGRSYADFLEAATRRAALWQGNTERADEIDPALVARARAVGGTWYFLAVAVDACSDSGSTIPYLAELVERVDGLEMRIVDSTVGRSVMESHRTPDGRAATPTVLLLDDAFGEAGCFIERPPPLQTWILESSDWSGQEVYENKMAWYDDDAGGSTVEAFVEMLETASEGGRVCR